MRAKLLIMALATAETAGTSGREKTLIFLMIEHRKKEKDGVQA